jgi:hypothetical protein
MCVFCLHYRHDAGSDAADCRAFQEIPDEIFVGGFDHRRAFPGDNGVRFVLAPDMADDFAEVMAVKAELEKTLSRARG